MNKWILIEVQNGDIFEPDVYNSYELAYKEMKRRFELAKVDNDEASIHKDYASIQSDYDNFDWRIFEINIDNDKQETTNQQLKVYDLYCDDRKIGECLWYHEVQEMIREHKKYYCGWAKPKFRWVEV